MGGCLVGGLFAGAGARESSIAGSYAEVDLHQVRSRTSPSRSESGRRRRVGAIGTVATLSRERRERRRIGPQRRDLERGGGCALELLLELEVSTGVAACSVRGVAERGERFLPGPRIRLGQGSRALFDRLCLSGDAWRLVPHVVRATRDHRHQAGREGDGERRGRPPSGGLTAGGKPLEEGVEPQVEVVVVLQSRTSLRRVREPFLDFGLCRCT